MIYLDDSQSNYLCKLIMQNLATLSDIRFISERQAFYQEQFWSPIFAMYDQCILHPKWCQKTLQRFAFVVECIAADHHFDDLDYASIRWLYCVKRKFMELAEILDSNNVDFLFQFK
eukprot:TRINITY_DN11137_c0_g1_i1.p1 TRINITY_DN11137_c0_g1~~TRINITY_DN11137_c0_g1_i1.p1  ORF type:complete len:116 (-),score=9.75 TRINITY_DN11137_c0_g1_i1:156-503(-)